MFKETFQAIKPIIFVAWIVAILRLITEARTEDLNIVGMMSVYMAVAVMFLFCGFTGQLDKLVWKKLLVAPVILAVSCWFIPNTIAYTVAQFQGWEHGRYYVDEEHWEIAERHRADGAGFFEGDKLATEELGREGKTRSGPAADTSMGKVKNGLIVGLFTTLAGAVWCLILGVLFVGIPATMRKRRIG